MSPATLARPDRTPAPAEQQALVPLSPTEVVVGVRKVSAEFEELTTAKNREKLTVIAGRLRRLGKMVAALSMVEGPSGNAIAVVIEGPGQEAEVVVLYKEQRSIEKATADHFKALDKAKREWNASEKEIKDLSKPLGGLLSAGLVLVRERIEKEAAEQARKQAVEDEAVRLAEEKRLRGIAKKLRGPERREVLDDARAVAEDRVDPAQAAQEARERTQQIFRGAGRAPTRTYYSAIVDDIGELVCAVVASDSILGTRVHEIVNGITKGDLDRVGLEALRAHLPELNRRVAGNKQLNIPGVSVTSRSSVTNT